MAQKTDKEKKRPLSLLDPQARGGDTGERGYSFQGKVLLSYIARWLSFEGFTSLLREGLGDSEARFFVPGRGYKKEFVEVKDHLVTPAEFWKEVARFRELDALGKGEYQWFTLATAGMSEDLHPLVNAMRRVRGPQGFYESSSVVSENSFMDYVDVVSKLGHAEDAEFLFEKVLIEPDLSLNHSHAEGLFMSRLNEYHPWSLDVPPRHLTQVYEALNAYVQTRLNTTITRGELESVIREGLPQDYRPHFAPVLFHTGTGGEADPIVQRTVYFPWGDFSGNESRTYPPAEDWNDRLLVQLREAKEWLLEHRATRRIRLSGQRRISASLALGTMFPSVEEGFVLEIPDRDNTIWATDAHADDATPPYTINVVESTINGPYDQVVVSFGISREVWKEAKRYLEQEGLNNVPSLHLKGENPVVSPQQANLLVQKLKGFISDAVSQTGAQQIHLFLAVPSQVALFLGHRLNATCAVQCYERVAANQYVRTCTLGWLK